MDTSKTEEETSKYFALFHSGSMVFRSLRSILASFCFLGHLMGQGAVLNGTIKETHAHDRYLNNRFNLFTRCQPMHLHVGAQDVVGDSASTYEYIHNEKLQKEIRELAERRLRTARLYKEAAQNYLDIRGVQLDKSYDLTFQFKKVLYDQATDRWNHATTFATDVEVEHAFMNMLSFILDHFLEKYVEENKAFCH